jgi:hypothetical protein
MSGALDDPGHIDASLKTPARGWRRHLLFWPVTVGAAYWVVTVAVATAEYFSELSKLSRGMYTDTVSPFFIVHVLTFPTSALISDWHGFTGDFDQGRWERDLRNARGPVLLNVVIETVLIAIVVLVVVFVARRQRRAVSEPCAVPR